MVAEPKENRLWYVRREGSIRGPFPRGKITREILLGRIRDSDELSHDREQWKPLMELPQLLPEVMRRHDGEGAEQRLTLTRLREDERQHSRRGAGRAARGPERRHGDRRNVESFDAVEHRAVGERRVAEGTREERNLLVPAATIMVVVFVLVTYFLWYRPATPGPARDCEAPPAPGINWNRCPLSGRNLSRADLHGANLGSAVLRRADLQGVNLTGADLSHANLETADLRGAALAEANLKGAVLRGANLGAGDLRNADLASADLRGATLGDAQLAGAKFEKAIWTDARVCGPGSVGECR